MSPFFEPRRKDPQRTGAGEREEPYFKNLRALCVLAVNLLGLRLEVE